MRKNGEVLCAGIVVADHICTPISHLPAAGELVLADRLLLTIGGCAANVAVDLVKLGVRATVLGVVTPGPGDYLARLREVLPHVDVFLPNNHEAELITGEKEPLRQAEVFHRLGARTSIVTLGGDGAVVVGDGVRLRAGAFAVPFVDGSGGGDAFAAGYIAGLLDGRDVEGCLTLASALGASCVQAVGTTKGVFTRAPCVEFPRNHSM